MLSEVGIMDEKHYNPLIGKSRLGDCEVCGNQEARYTCPACEVKTCSLPCVSVHKKELDCSGLRNRVKFKHLSNFSDMDLQSDYMLLEEIGRGVEKIVKSRRPLQKNLAFKWQKMKQHLWRRGTQLQILPPKFSKHLNNTSYLNWKNGVIYWKLEWIFPQASPPNLSVTDNRVDETCLVSDLVQKYMDVKTLSEPVADRLNPYREAGGVEAVRVLMRAERVSGGARYFLFSSALSLSENLQGKLVIEHPTLYVVLSSQIQNYQIVSTKSVYCNDESRRGRYRARSVRSCGSMRFFSDHLSDSDST